MPKTSPTLVRVKTKFQVTLPTALRRKIGVRVGDILEAKIEGKKISFMPKSLIDKHLAEALEDMKHGRVYGPFSSVDELMESLDRNASRLSRRSAKKARVA